MFLPTRPTSANSQAEVHNLLVTYYGLEQGSKVIQGSEIKLHSFYNTSLSYNVGQK